MPKRIQRQRAKGWRAPAGAVYVGRPSKWGNPFVAWRDGGSNPYGRAVGPGIAVRGFRELLAEQWAWSPIPPHKWPRGKVPAQFTSVEDVKRELCGKDLMCWCPLVDDAGQPVPCHADVLLEIANG